MKSAIRHQIILTITANGFQQIWDGSQFVNADQDGWDHEGEWGETHELASRWHDATNAIETDKNGAPEGTLTLTNEAQIWESEPNEYESLPADLAEQLLRVDGQPEIELWTF